MLGKIKVIAAIFAVIWFSSMLFTCMGCDDDDYDDDYYGGDGGGDYESYIYIQMYADANDTNPRYIPVYSKDTFRLDIPTRQGYTFTGLYDAPEGGMQIVNQDGYLNVDLAADITLYAQWLGATYTFNFNTDGGELIAAEPTAQFAYGASLTIFPVPVKDGFEFKGWQCGGELCSNPDGTPLEGKTMFNSSYPIGENGVELIAVWAERTVTIVFDYNDGSFVTKEVVVAWGGTLPLSEFITDDTGNKEIVGWSYAMNSSTPITSDLVDLKMNFTLYALWRYYTVATFDECNGNVVTDKVYMGATYNTYVPEKDGYEFDGWYDSKIFSGNPIVQIQYHNVKETYYARWVPKKYTIEFVVDGEFDGDISQLEYTIESGVAYPNISKDKYTFLGWCKNEDMSDTPAVAIGKGNFGDLKLYAKFRGDDREVLLDTQGGTVPTSKLTVEYGAKNALPVPVLPGYAFVGWYNGETKFTGKDGVSLEKHLYDESVSLTARYSKKYYITVEIAIPGATVAVNDYYVAGEGVLLQLEQTDMGYDFVGYYNGQTLMSENAEHSFFMPESDLNIRVELTPRVFKVQFDTAGGFEIGELSEVTYGKTFTLPVAYKAGFAFDGWALSDGTLITDKNGVSLKTWTQLNNVILTATYVEDTDGTIVYITDIESFNKITENMGGSYVLVADLDFTDKGYVTPSAAFTGTLDGSGHKIIGLKTPLFSDITGIIRNLEITANISESSSTTVGVLAGSAGGSARVLNITVRGAIALYGKYEIGGVIGRVRDSAVLENCISHVSLISDAIKGDGSCGGIVGVATNSSSLTNCVNRGNIIGKFVAGVAAYVDTVNISNCHNLAMITGTEYVGGVIGYAIYGGGTVNYTNLTNKGAVSGGNYTGGVIGYFYLYGDSGYGNHHSNVTLDKLTNSGNVSGGNYVGGIAGYYYAQINCRSGYDAWSKLTSTSLGNSAGVSGLGYVGGLFGYAHTDNGDSKISGASSSGYIKAEYFVGGFAGQLDAIQIVNSTNKGTAIEATKYLLDGSTYLAYVGGYAGYGGIANGCTNESDIVYSESGIYVGGIFGYSVGSLYNCTNTGIINAPKASYVGGIVGSTSYGGGNVTYQNLKNTGVITGLNYTGGVAGYFKLYGDSGYGNHHSVVELTNVVNSGEVTGSSYTSGLVAYFHVQVDCRSGYDAWSKLIATGLANTANVTGTSYVGGLFGYAHTDNGDSNITGATSSGHMKAEYFIGGFAGQLDNIQIVNSTNKGTTIEATKYLLDGSTYYAYVGGYVGYGGTVTGCVNETDISYAEKGAYVGGIVGYTTGHILNCSNSGSISAPKSSYVGGLVGRGTYSGGNISYKELKNTGAVTGADYTGGVIGYFSLYGDSGYGNHHSVIEFTNVSNEGAITGNTYTAGLVAYFHVKVDCRSGYDAWSRLIATQISNDADITGLGYVGGLFGYAYSDHGDSNISSSSSSGNIKAEYFLGGLAGQLENIQILNCSNKGTTIEATKYLLSGTTYYAYVGGYVGRGGTINGCVNETAIKYDQKGAYVGGIAGYSTGHILNCSNTASIEAPKASYVGGLVGEAYYSGGNVNYKELSNTGAVTGVDYTGGIAGRFSLYANSGYGNHYSVVEFTNVSNEGAITGGTYTAGLVAYFHVKADCNSGYTAYSQLVATGISNSGDINGVMYVGGLFGYAYSDNGDSSIIDSSSSGSITAECYIGGLAGKLENIQINDCSNKGTTISATKYLLEGTTYYAYVGGYVGYGGTITGCVNETEIIYTQRGRYVGGIAGVICGNLVSCTNLAKVEATQADYVGGLAGYASYAGGSRTYSAVKNSGAVTGNDYTGGIIGYLYSYTNSGYGNHEATISATGIVNEGAVTGGTYVGGFMGAFFGNVVCNSGYSAFFRLVGIEITNTGDVTGTNTVGGFFGSFSSDTASTVEEYSSTGTVTATGEGGAASETVATNSNLTFE